MNVEALAEALLYSLPYTGASREAVVELLQECTERRLSAGEVLCKERTYGDEMFFLVEGRIEVSRVDARGERHHLVTMPAPDMLGHITLIDSGVRSATLTAQDDVLVRVLPRASFVRLIHASIPAGTALRRLVLTSLHQQLSRAHQQISGGGTVRRALVIVEDDHTEDIEAELGR